MIESLVLGAEVGFSARRLVDAWWPQAVENIFQAFQNMGLEDALAFGLLFAISAMVMLINGYIDSHLKQWDHRWRPIA